MNDQQLLRYSRHILLPEVDIDGQKKILSSKVLIIGLGGLGSPVAMYLAAAGVGELMLADFDRVDQSNLQRQIIHTQAAVGQAKVESARRSLLQINSELHIEAIDQQLDAASIDAYVVKADVVVDCSDRLSTRLMVNKSCVKFKTPLVSGAAIGWEGQLAVFDLAKSGGPCYACVYQNADDSLRCAEAGVLSPLVGVIGSMQALEALKVLLGLSHDTQLMLYDAKRLQWQNLAVKKNPSCLHCA